MMKQILAHFWGTEKDPIELAQNLACGGVACKRGATGPGINKVPTCRTGFKAAPLTSQCAGCAQRTVAVFRTGMLPCTQTGGASLEPPMPLS